MIGLAEFHQFAQVHIGRVVGAAGSLLHIVRDDGDRVVALQFADQLFDLRGRDRVQRGRRLVQQQRLCIARGVAVKPDVLLLDEPTSALDPISTSKIEELISELKGDYTIAIVTHNMQQAARCSDYTAYMYLGELVEFGETDQLFLNPVRKETQDYITGRFG